MNTYTNTMHPEKKVDPAAHNDLFPKIAILIITFMLVTALATAVYIDRQSVAAAENNLAVPYGNALEMQYARPWLEAQSKPVVAYSNALELQYARPWLQAQKQPAVVYSNALELQYAQPWLDKSARSIAAHANQDQIPLRCSSSMEMLYACKYGVGLP